MLNYLAHETGEAHVEPANAGAMAGILILLVVLIIVVRWLNSRGQ